MKACASLLGLVLLSNLLVNCRTDKKSTPTASSASASSAVKSAPKPSEQDKRSADTSAATELVKVYAELASVHEKHANSCETLVKELADFRARNQKQLRA